MTKASSLLLVLMLLAVSACEWYRSGEGLGRLPAAGALQVQQVPLPHQEDLPQIPRDAKIRPVRPVMENEVFVKRGDGYEYKIGPGDTLTITVNEGLEEKEYERRVRPNGDVVVQGFVVSAKGLTPGEVSEKLREQFATITRDPRVDVVVKECKSKSVFLLGAVQSLGGPETGPGKYYLSGRTTAFELIYQAGGPTESAELKGVQVRRRDGKLVFLNLYRLMVSGDNRYDLELDDGDYLIVPDRKQPAAKTRFFVLGEVKEPGMYTSDERINVLQAIAVADGFTENAVVKDVRVIRGELDKAQLLPVDLAALTQGQGPHGGAWELANNDVIFVPKAKITDWNAFLAKLTPTLRFLALPFMPFGPEPVYGFKY